MIKWPGKSVRQTYLGDSRTVKVNLTSLGTSFRIKTSVVSKACVKIT